MAQDRSGPSPRLTVVTLGVADMRRSLAFYEALGFDRRLRATGEEVAFFATGGAVLALYPWSRLAADATLLNQPPAPGFRGMTLAWNCRSEGEVDEVLSFAVGQGATLLKAAHRTGYGGYSGYFADPDGHPWEVVVAPGLVVDDGGRVHLPD